MTNISKVLTIILLCFCVKTNSQTQICSSCDYTGWMYYQKVAINNASNSSTLSSFQVSLTVNTQALISAGKMNSAGNDIRFTSQCSGGTNYGYWIESGINTATTLIWVNVPTVSANSVDTMYLHYGNNSAVAASSGTATFPFFDDFESLSLSNWTFSSGTWSITNLSGNNVLASSNLITGNGHTALLNSSLGLTDYYVEVNNMYSVSNAYGGPLFEHNDFSNYYAYHYMPDVQATMHSLISNGSANYSITDAATGAANVWYPWSVKRTTGTIDVYFNSALTRTVTSAFSDGVGVWTWGTSTGIVYFDNIRVRKATSIQPALSIGTNTYVTAATMSVAGNFDICTGETAIVYASGVHTYSWSNSATTATVNLNPTSNTTYTVTGTNTLSGCSNTTVKTVTVFQLPVVSINGGTTPICSGQPATLTANGGNTFLWVVLNATTQAISISPTITTTYMVHATDVNGCMDMASKTITVNPLPTLTVSGATAVCLGSGTTLTVTGASTYTWNSSGPNTNTLAVAPSTNTMYMVHGRDANGCENMSMYNLTVNSLPTVGITGPLMSCAGDLLTFTATGATTYTWNTNVSTATIAPSPTANASYSVIGTNNNGCVSSALHSVMVHSLPTVAISSSTTEVCNGEVLSLSGSGADTYTWSNTFTTATITETLSSTTIYTLVGTDLMGCVNSSQYTITVNPVPTLAISGPTAICSGQSATLTASGADTYIWSNFQPVISIVVSPTANTTYSVIGTYTNNGCMSLKSTGIIVNPLPVLAISGQTVICSGNALTLTGTGATSYSWNGVAGTNTVSGSPSASTVYTLNGTDANGCGASAVHSVTVNVLPAITATTSAGTICVGETATLVVSGGLTYIWNTTDTNDSLIVSPLINTDYTVTGTDNNGCENTAILNQLVSECTGLNELNSEISVQVYPNPNTGSFTIKGAQDIKIALRNQLGQVIRFIELNSGNEYKVSVSDLAKGLYYITGQNNNQRIGQKIIVGQN